MRKSLGVKSVEVFESFCCKCGDQFDFSQGVEKSGTLDFEFGFFDIGMDSFRQKIELCGECSAEVFLELHKTLQFEAKKEYFSYKDDWLIRKRKGREGILCVGDAEEIT